MGIVISYTKQKDGKYQVIADIAQFQNKSGSKTERKTINSCYKFKTGLQAPLVSLRSSDGYYFLKSEDTFLDQYKYSSDTLKKIIYYYDKLIPLKNGEPTQELIDVSKIENNTFDVSIPADYCFNVDPPHPLLTPVCKNFSESSSQNIFQNQKLLPLFVVGCIIILSIFSSGVFFLFQ